MWAPLGDRAIRFARPAGVPAQELVARARSWARVVDVVVAPHDVAVYFDDAPAVTAAQLAALAEPAVVAADAASAAPVPQLAALAEPPVVAAAAAPREVVLRVVYDGADLAEVAAAVGLSVAEVIERHAAAVYTVDAMGFLPGFAYLTGLDARLCVPRRSSPRARVPAGSLAIAAAYTAVYPFDSPGGWHLLGRLDEPVEAPPLFGPAGARLRLGDRVRFARSAR